MHVLNRKVCFSVLNFSDFGPCAATSGPNSARRREICRTAAGGSRCSRGRGLVDWPSSSVDSRSGFGRSMDSSRPASAYAAARLESSRVLASVASSAQMAMVSDRSTGRPRWGAMRARENDPEWPYESMTSRALTARCATKIGGAGGPGGVPDKDDDENVSEKGQREMDRFGE